MTTLLTLHTSILIFFLHTRPDRSGYSSDCTAPKSFCSITFEAMSSLTYSPSSRVHEVQIDWVSNGEVIILFFFSFFFSMRLHRVHQRGLSLPRCYDRGPPRLNSQWRRSLFIDYAGSFNIISSLTGEWKDSFLCGNHENSGKMHMFKHEHDQDFIFFHCTPLFIVFSPSIDRPVNSVAYHYPVVLRPRL